MNTRFMRSAATDSRQGSSRARGVLYPSLCTGHLSRKPKHTIKGLPSITSQRLKAAHEAAAAGRWTRGINRRYRCPVSGGGVPTSCPISGVHLREDSTACNEALPPSPPPSPALRSYTGGVIRQLVPFRACISAKNLRSATKL